MYFDGDYYISEFRSYVGQKTQTNKLNHKDDMFITLKLVT